VEIFGIQKPMPEIRIVYKDRPVVAEEKSANVDAETAFALTLKITETERDIWKEVATKLLDKNS